MRRHSLPRQNRSSICTLLSIPLLGACREALADVFDEVDILIEPSATGEVPRGLENPGDSAFNRMWTALHVPCVSLPVLHDLRLAARTAGDRADQFG